MNNTLGVVFDMDGVLVLTEKPHWQSWVEAANLRSVTLDYAKFLSCFGRINPDCIRILFGEHIPPDESHRIAEDKEAAFRDIIRKDIPLAPGAVDLLNSLRQRGIRNGIGSSAPKENVDLVLDAGKIRVLIDGIANGSEVARGKPAPDVFLLAAQRMGVDPKNCAVIEDAPAGIQAAVAAGMLPIAVTTTHREHELKAAGATLIFPTLADLSTASLEHAIKSHQ